MLDLSQKLPVSAALIQIPSPCSPFGSNLSNSEPGETGAHFILRTLDGRGLHCVHVHICSFPFPFPLPLHTCTNSLTPTSLASIAVTLTWLLQHSGGTGHTTSRRLGFLLVGSHHLVIASTPAPDDRGCRNQDRTCPQPVVWRVLGVERLGGGRCRRPPPSSLSPGS